VTIHLSATGARLLAHDHGHLSASLKIAEKAAGSAVLRKVRLTAAKR